MIPALRATSTEAEDGHGACLILEVPSQGHRLCSDFVQVTWIWLSFSLHIFKNARSITSNQTKKSSFWQWPLANAPKKLQETRYRQPHILAASGQVRELLAKGCIYVQYPPTNLTFTNLFFSLFIIQTATLMFCQLVLQFNSCCVKKHCILLVLKLLPPDFPEHF